jgi:NADH:ubiquinone oxidoreductase subunit E
MGSYELYHYLEDYVDKNPGKIELKASPCLDSCNSGSDKAPFVLIDGKIHSEMTVEKLKDIIRK